MVADVVGGFDDKVRFNRLTLPHVVAATADDAVTLADDAVLFAAAVTILAVWFRRIFCI